MPALRVALAFAAGLSTGLYAWRPPLWWLVAAIAFVASDIILAGKELGQRMRSVLARHLLLELLQFKRKAAVVSAGQVFSSLQTEEKSSLLPT
jgi:hypothetical protein